MSSKVWKKEYLPNLLTVIRILLVPFIVIFLFLKGSTIYRIQISGATSEVTVWTLISGLLFIVAMITDYVDGYLARKNNWVSNFGKIWDPVADKMLINSLLISFCYLRCIPIYLVILMICRDIIVDAARISSSSNNIIIAANRWGKYKTFTQMIGLLIIYFILNFNYQCCSSVGTKLVYYLVQNICMFAATGMSLFSGVLYLVNAYVRKESQR